MDINSLFKAALNTNSGAPEVVALQWHQRDLYEYTASNFTKAKKAAFTERLSFFENLEETCGRFKKPLVPVMVLVCPYASFFVAIFQDLNDEFMLCQFSGNEKISSERLKHPFTSSFSMSFNSLLYRIVNLSYYQKRAKPTVNPFKKGDVLYSSSGYEQTNVCFYEVLSVTKSTVTVAEIKAIELENNDMTGAKVPEVGNYISDPINRKVLDNEIKICDYERARALEYTMTAGVRIYKPCSYSFYG